MEDCKACKWIANEEGKPNLVWSNDNWVLRHSAAPYPALGWMTMHSRRHIPGVTALTAAEAAELGTVLQKISLAQIKATGALRVYMGSLSEGTPHFHIHLVPRFEGGPKGWEAFADLARAREGLTQVDAYEVERVIDAVGAILQRELGGRVRKQPVAA